MTAVMVRNSRSLLNARIGEVETRLLNRQSRMKSLARGIGEGVRTRVTSPTMLASAVAFGVLIERRTRTRTWSLGTAFNLLSTYGALAMTLVSATRRVANSAAIDNAPAGIERD